MAEEDLEVAKLEHRLVFRQMKICQEAHQQATNNAKIHRTPGLAGKSSWPRDIDFHPFSHKP